jgi:hypothetical protein
MGTEAFWIPAAMAAVGGITSAVNSRNATKRQNNSVVQSMADQQTYKDQANSAVNKMTQNINTSNPAALANKETGDFVKTLRSNVGGAASSSLGPVPGASSRYNTDKAAASADTQSYGNTNATEMSAVDAAINQRRNEAGSMQSLGAHLNTLGAESQAKSFTDQLRTQAAGVQNPWVSMFSNVMGGTANGMSRNGWFNKGTGIPTGTGGSFVNGDYLKADPSTH